MSHIAGLPCDILKIDRSFVNAMLHERKSMALVQAMIQLAHDLGLQAVAEGVENTEQEATLRALGCEAAQGFHYSRPVPWTNCWFGCSNARSAALQGRAEHQQALRASGSLR